ncbi:MAG: TonB-dependent receptor [Pyrinomonadaceae bacterium]
MRSILSTPILNSVLKLSGMALMIFGVLISAIQINAQGTRGTIRGTVTDPNGSVVPNATVKLVDPAKGTDVRVVQTNENGAYQIIEIDPSVYNLIVTADNFSEFRVTSVKVEPNRNLTLDAKLSIGQMTNEVTVTAGAELIDRESATLGTTVDNRRVEGLPLNGRNVLNLALLQPGVAPSSSGFGSGLGIRVNGSRGVENNLTLDGANNNEVAVGGAIGGQPRPDAVQEFRILSSNFEAEFGRNTGAVINVVTRSGTNQFHGNGRFFYRPTFLSAARFLDKALPPAGTAPGADLRRTFERKEFGFNIGGPIYFLNFGEGVPFIYKGQDKSFFFLDFERRGQKVGATQTITNLPTPLEISGDFSQSGTIIDPATGLPFPNNRIPTNRFSPIAQYYLQFLPEADATGQAQVGADQITINNFFTLRLDHNISENHLLNFTANYTDTDDADPFAFGGANVPGFGSVDLRKTKNYIGKYTYVINPNLVNSLLINISKNKQPGVAPVNQTTPEEIGFQADFVSNRQFAGPPQLRLFDRGIIIGNSIQGPQSRVTENYQIQNSVSWVLGPHRMKFGVDATKYKQGQDFVFINQGLLQFSGSFGGNTTGNDFADLLIGNSPIATQYGAAGRRDSRQLAFAGFGQDTWNIGRNLTLSFGLRYEYVSPLKDLLDRVAFYRPGSTSPQLAAGSRTFNGLPITIAPGGRAPNGLVYVGDPDNVLGGTVPRGGVAPDRNNFAPRVGFAYSFSGAGDGLFSKLLGENVTVIRGGFGLYYGAVIGDTQLQQLNATGYGGTNASFFPNGGTLADPFAPDPFPNYQGLQATSTNPFLASGINVNAPIAGAGDSQPLDPNLKTPQVSQFNLTFERGFFDDYVLGISYVGNRGRKLYVREEINPALGTFLPTTLRLAGQPAITGPITINNGNTRRVNADYLGNISLLTTAGNSTFDSLQVNFQKRYGADGLLFQTAYTFSKSINDSDTQRGGLDLIDRSFGRALSDDDAPHRFVGSFIYELPFFRNTSGFLKRLLDGWSIGGIYTYQSGTVFSVANTNNTIEPIQLSALQIWVRHFN